MGQALALPRLATVESCTTKMGVRIAFLGAMNGRSGHPVERFTTRNDFCTPVSRM